MDKINVAIIGASGYTGLELIKLLICHPKFNLVYIGNTQGGCKVSDLHPSLLNVFDMSIEKSDAKKVAKTSKLAFLALPHKTSMSFAKELIELGVKVVDLSADYRLNIENYEKHYGTHEDKENLKNAVYGLPEINKKKIQKADFVANPGCYPTASLLAILPFKEYIKQNTPIIIDAKSGVSGAGKTLSESTHFINVNENFTTYNAFKHRHEPEISQILKEQGVNANIYFVPHLLPISRGMLVSAYIQVNSKFDVFKVLSDFYNNEEFVRVRKDEVNIKQSVGTNFCDIFAIQKDSILFVSASIDNLLRGASSQAVVNANIMFGFNQNMGIPKIAYVP